MRESNYRFNCLPDQHRATGAFVFTVDVREDFLEFAKTQTLDHVAYETEGFQMLDACGFNKQKVISYGLDRTGIYTWHNEFSGLLLRVMLPGWEENYIELSNMSRNWHIFGVHNIDCVEQFAAGFLLLNKWLRDIDLRMPK